VSCITIEQLAKVFPKASGEILDMVLRQMDVACLTKTKEVAAAFVAQIGHESIDLTHTAEIDEGRVVKVVDGKPVKVKPDYWPYFGRGYIQVTWRQNYVACGKALGLDLIAQPELLELPEHAMASAIWFYMTHGLQNIRDIDTISTRINGAGIKQASKADRRRRYDRALSIFSS
jgi:putative chitinase